MARISFSPLVTAASGKVKDTVFSKWKGRAYIRARVTPANPQSVDQMAVRDSMARTVSLWQSTNSATKLAWGSYASPYSISGYNAFVKANRAAEQMSEKLEFTPVNPLVPQMPPLIVEGGASSGHIKLSWDTGAVVEEADLVVSIRRQGKDVFEVVAIVDGGFQDEAYDIAGIEVGTFTDIYLCAKSQKDIAILYGQSAGLIHIPEGAA